MEQHLTFYQAQYQPSFEADQAKIDDFGIDSLNTPDINPEFFTDAPILFGKSALTVTKVAPIKDEDYSLIFSDLGITAQPAVTSAFDRTTYSPYSEDTKQHLDSSAININSPEMMMPVSPNKVCPTMGYEDLPEQSTFQQMNEYESLAAFDNYHHSSPSASSTCNSRSSSISAGSDSYNLSEYLGIGPNVDHSASHLMTSSTDPTLMYRVPQSPANSISSHYSSESGSSANKTFTNLETVQQPQIVIKQEPVDALYQPTVVEEFETSAYHMQPMQPSHQTMPITGSYSTINASDLTQGYYYSNPLPSTVSGAIMQQQTQQAPQPAATTPTNGGRKRTAASAFASASHQQAGTSGASGSTKKPRMTKREKQKLMESEISKFENENRDLRQSIHLFERQIAFCKRFLSENVAPVIRHQHMNMLPVEDL